MPLSQKDFTIACVVLCLLIALCFFAATYHDDRIECGACGARVTDVWYVLDDTGTEWVPVCSKCEETISQNS